MRKLLLVVPFALLAGCIVRPGYGYTTYRPAPVVAEPRAEVYYYGNHFIPESAGGGWCYIDGPHMHDYAPDRADYYDYDQGYYWYRGPFQFSFFGGHPLPGGGWCYINGPHQHDYYPPRGSDWRWNRNGYVYSGEYRPNRPPPANYWSRPALRPDWRNRPSVRPAPAPARRPDVRPGPGPGPIDRDRDRDRDVRPGPGPIGRDRDLGQPPRIDDDRRPLPPESRGRSDESPGHGGTLPPGRGGIPPGQTRDDDSGRGRPDVGPAPRDDRGDRGRDERIERREPAPSAPARAPDDAKAKREKKEQKEKDDAADDARRAGPRRR